MKISDLLNITGGRAVNEPSVQAVEGATVFPSKVEMGDCFFAANSKDIEAAVANDAYAVIFEGTAQPNISDTEIAWIRVDSVRDAAFRLLRYVLLRKEADFYLLQPYEMSFLQMILTRKDNIVFLPPEWTKAFEAILNGQQHLFVSSDRKLMKTIRPDIAGMDESSEGDLILDTLFRCSFKIEKYIYQNKEIAPFHLEYLMRVVAFCNSHQLPWSMDKLRYTRHFQPVYVDAKLRPVARGSSDRVVIFVDNIEDIVKAKEYIRYHSRWARSIVLTPPKTKIENVNHPYWFTTPDEAKEILKKTDFNYAFVYSLDRELLRDAKEENTLF